MDKVYFRSNPSISFYYYYPENLDEPWSKTKNLLESSYWLAYCPGLPHFNDGFTINKLLWSQQFSGSELLLSVLKIDLSLDDMVCRWYLFYPKYLKKAKNLDGRNAANHFTCFVFVDDGYFSSQCRFFRLCIHIMWVLSLPKRLRQNILNI
jgi:hypothetical protein